MIHRTIAHCTHFFINSCGPGSESERLRMSGSRMQKRWVGWLTVLLVFLAVSVSLSCSRGQRDKKRLALYPWDSPIAFHPNEARKDPCLPIYYGMGDGDGVLDPPCHELQEQLTAAAGNGRVQKIKELLEAGANANATVDSISALQAAAGKGHFDAALLLLNNGADVNHYHAISGTPLTHAIYGGHANVVALLLSRGANPNVDPDGGTPLSVAKKQKNLRIIALLEMVGARE